MGRMLLTIFLVIIVVPLVMAIVGAAGIMGTLSYVLFEDINVIAAIFLIGICIVGILKILFNR